MTENTCCCCTLNSQLDYISRSKETRHHNVWIMCIKETTQFQCTYFSSIFVTFHIDECKASRSSSLMIINDLYVLNGTVTFKNITQFSLLCIQTESKNAETSALTRIALQQTTETINHLQKTNKYSITIREDNFRSWKWNQQHISTVFSISGGWNIQDSNFDRASCHQ